MPQSQEPSDAELMRQVADGAEAALGVLHRRFGRLILGLAVRTLERAAAEDVVQDVFLAVWRNAGTFDPERGPVRSWVLQIAHFRILNELRRRSRQPPLEPDPEGVLLASLPDRGPDPHETAWQEERRAALTSALEGLPAAQREALRLALLEDRSHAEVAAALQVPLGTAKTRIRAGLQKLRTTLAPRAAALAALGVLCLALGIRYRAEHETLDQYDRALSMVTVSDSVNLRLVPPPGTPEATHAHYHGRPGASIAVITLSKFPPAPTGQTYQVWARYGTVWTSLGTAQPDAEGTARLIAERAVLTTLPDAVQVTLEPRAGSATPSGPVVVAWKP